MWTSCPRAATRFAIGSMKEPTLSPGNLGYDVVTITTTWRMLETLARAEDEPPRHEQRLDQDVRRELRRAEAALDEDDRRLGDAEPAALRLEQHFDEEGVAVRNHAGDRKLRQRLAAPAAGPAPADA